MVDMPQGAKAGTAFGAVQTSCNGAPACQALIGGSSVSCAVAAGQPLVLKTGDIMALTWRTANASIGSFANLFDVDFTGVPSVEVDGNG